MCLVSKRDNEGLNCRDNQEIHLDPQWKLTAERILRQNPIFSGFVLALFSNFLIFL